MITLKRIDGTDILTHGETMEECIQEALRRELNLAGAYLAGVYLAGVDLEGVYLAGVDLEGAYLIGANLGGANLEGATLVGAYLEGAYLAGAYLAGANLAGAYLIGANLAGAYGITPRVLQILGTRHALIVRDYGRISIGCHTRTVEEWEATYKLVGEDEGYSAEQVAEYGEHIASARRFMERYHLMVAPETADVARGAR